MKVRPDPDRSLCGSKSRRRLPIQLKKAARLQDGAKLKAVSIYDDNEANRDIMGRMLALRGYEPEFRFRATRRSTSRTLP